MVWKVNPFSSGLFACRRVEKAEQQNGQAELPLLAGQTASAGKAVRTTFVGCGNGFVKGISSCMDSFENICQSGKGIFATAAKTVNVISEHINPAICVTAGVQVYLADDKEEAFAERGMGLACMFPAEHAMKEAIGGKGEEIANKMYNLVKTGAPKSTKSVTENVAKTLAESKDSKMKLAGIIIEGVALVGASVSASAIGGAVGKDLHVTLKRNTSPNSLLEQTRNA